MPWQPIATGVLIVFFLLLGRIWPRTEPAIDWKVSAINVGTGAMLAVVRTGILIALAAPLAALDGGLVDLELVSWVPLQILLVYILLDFAKYWLHYAHHRVPALWFFHRTHHSSEHLNATSGLRMHLVDVAQLTLVPIVVFGILFDMSSFHPWILPGVFVAGAAMDAFEHANIRIDPKHPFWRTWDLVLNNPHFHSWHHTREGAYKDGNYGLGMTIWDRLFGTEVTEDEPPELYGLGHQWIALDFIGLQLLRRRDDRDYDHH